MSPKDFSIFRALLSDIHLKAFGETLTPLPHGKAQTLSWLIYEATGEMLSYKSLSNYVKAALAGALQAINPSAATLSILAEFAGVEKRRQTPVPGLLWYEYRNRHFQALAA